MGFGFGCRVEDTTVEVVVMAIVVIDIKSLAWFALLRGASDVAAGRLPFAPKRSGSRVGPARFDLILTRLGRRTSSTSVRRVRMQR